MKVFISADMEGITGLVAWGQCGRPNSDHYDFAFAREMITHDVNAAIRGARNAGASEIVVKDSHGSSKNILLNQLEPGVRLISGYGCSDTDGMMQGINETFDAAMLIGYHAMAGTQAGIMEHTIMGQIHRMKINGMPAGEIALSAGVASSYGVPIVCVSSDFAGAAEAEKLLPGVATAVVKTGLARYMGDCLHPSETAPLIEAAAELGCLKAKEIEPWRPFSPVTVTVEFNRSEEADCAGRLNGVVRPDTYTIEFTGQDYAEAHRVAWSIFSMGGNGAGANT
jgi:D-amino peptidase